MVLVGKTDNPPKGKTTLVSVGLADAFQLSNVLRVWLWCYITRAPSSLDIRESYILVLLGYVSLILSLTPCLYEKQTVRIVALDHPKGLIRTGDRALVTFEFMGQPEFLKEGSMLLLREGRTKVSSTRFTLSF